MPYLISEIVEQELEQRAQLKAKIMSLIFLDYEIQNTRAACVKRGALQQRVYLGLGFHGAFGNDFAKFINQIMAENGFKVTHKRGHRIYRGLVCKDRIPEYFGLTT